MGPFWTPFWTPFWPCLVGVVGPWYPVCIGNAPMWGPVVVLGGGRWHPVWHLASVEAGLPSEEAQAEQSAAYGCLLYQARRRACGQREPRESTRGADRPPRPAPPAQSLQHLRHPHGHLRLPHRVPYSTQQHTTTEHHRTGHTRITVPHDQPTTTDGVRTCTKED